MDPVANAHGAVVVVPDACVDAVCFGVVGLALPVRGEVAWVFGVPTVGAPVEVAPQEAIRIDAAANPRAAVNFVGTREIYPSGI